MRSGRYSAIRFRNGSLEFDRTFVMGVLNVTPDSFSDGGLHAGVDSAVSHGLRLIEEGADVLDVGGESTRPGAAPVSAREETERVVPVIRALASRARVPISVDTTKAEVAMAAIEAGAEIVNDVSGGLFDPDIVRVCLATGAAYICGHLRGRSLAEVHAAHTTAPDFETTLEELAARVFSLPAAVLSRTIVDPGLGFGKGTAENVELLRRAGEIGAALSRPVLVGPSRKRFLGELVGRGVSERDDATVGACLAAVAGGADGVRVHAVRPVRDALTVYERVIQR